MHDVELTRVKRVSDYATVVGEDTVEGLRALGRELRGARVVNVNATAYGGGVAEILQNLVPLMRDVGVDARWSVLDAPASFFDITKRVHNALQGMPLALSDLDEQLFMAIEQDQARELPEGDFVIAHDPQVVAFRHFAAERARGWVWRCHIDLTTAQQQVWAFLRPFVEEHDAAVFTMRQFVRPDLRMDRIVTMAPSIDPFSRKNADLPADECAAVVRRYGLDPSRPLIVQVSRFDPWKDPLGVIDAYRCVKQEIADVQLAMVGSLALDDPEGVQYLEKTQAHARGDPDVKLLSNLDGVGDVEVNAFQRAATVVWQKSIREGFGLTVSEALWKGVAVVGGKVGGIPLQIEDGADGFLVETVEECAERTLTLLRDPALRKRMGAAGREKVRASFLITRDLRDHLDLLRSLAAPARHV